MHVFFYIPSRVEKKSSNLDKETFNTGSCLNNIYYIFLYFIEPVAKAIGRLDICMQLENALRFLTPLIY